MAHYSVTFRIADKTVGNATYSERRQRLIDNVVTKGMGYWEETTSFFFVESNLDTASFGKKAIAGLSVKDDLVLIFDPSDMSACYFGPVEYPDVLRSFLPKGVKLT